MRNAVVPVLAAVLLWSCATPPPPRAPEPAPPAPAPVVETPPPAPEPAAGFPVSKEKKAASLTEIRALVAKLNGIIAQKNFSEWKTYLDQAYVTYYSDPVRLKEYSAQPFLKQFNVKLKTLEDYFKFVVVASRADGNDRVDDIAFEDENRVKVFSVVDNEPLLLYLLKLYGKEWKISQW